MNKALPLVAIALCISSTDTNAQNFADLDIGNVRARFHANGSIGTDDSGGLHFEVPRNSGIHALYASGLWIGGITSEEQLRVSRTLYPDGPPHFQPGPLSLTGTTTPQVSTQFEQVWSIYANDVVEHLAYHRCLGDPECDEAVEYPNGHTTPASFTQWPAHGPGPEYATNLAPYYDFNSDGAYDPEDGDAPCIIGDQALFFVYNDAVSSVDHTPIGLEVQAMPFAFEYGSDAIRNTVFVRYHLINRSTLTLTGTRLGLFADFDLGCSNDDYIGTDPGRNLFYTYNWDDDDESGCSGTLGYGSHPPAFGSMFIKGPLIDANGMDDPSENLLPAYNGSGFGNAVTDDERAGLTNTAYWNREGAVPHGPGSHNLGLYNFLRSIWGDNTNITYGGTGASAASGIPTHFVYPGADDPLGVGTNGIPQEPWYDTTHVYRDRRGVMSTGEFTLEPGEHVDIVLAFIYARDEDGTALESVAALQAAADEVKLFCEGLPLFDGPEEQGFAGQCANYPTLAIAERNRFEEVAFFPTPAGNTVSVRLPESRIAGQLIVRDALGRTVLTQRMTPQRNDLDMAALVAGVYTAEITFGTAHYKGTIVKE